MPWLSESGIPTQQIACLWNKSLKAFSVWYFPGLPEICSCSQWWSDGEGVYEAFNHEKSYLNLFQKHSVSWLPQEFYWQVVMSLLLLRLECTTVWDKQMVWISFSTFYWEIWKDGGKLESPFNERKLPDSLSVKIIFWSKSHSSNTIYVLCKIIYFHFCSVQNFTKGLKWSHVL